jgi:spermidine/putrescine transport system ATP-binding protein
VQTTSDSKNLHGQSAQQAATHLGNGSANKLVVRNIQKNFDSQTALSAVDLEIKKGEFFSLLGPSGCGKSTLLRILAGLDSADGGEIWWDGQRIDQLPARSRPFNMVFQKYALFPHLSVFENVAFGLRLKGVSSGEIRSRVEEVLALVNLKGYGPRLPETLSGGQAQRVALARALANRPACVLLDEPLTALDQKLREHMQTELRLLQRRLGLTFIFVTHDQEEAMLLSDRIAVMNAGRVEQVSTPRELYDAPQSIFSARFVGRRNEFSAQVANRDGDWVHLEIAGQPVLRGRNVQGVALSQQAQFFVSPERLRILSGSTARQDGFNVLEGQVVQVLFRGTFVEVILALNETTFLRALTDSSQGLAVGDRVGLEFSPHETHVFIEVME